MGNKKTLNISKTVLSKVIGKQIKWVVLSLPVSLCHQSATHLLAADHQISSHILPSPQSTTKNNYTLNQYFTHCFNTSHTCFFINFTPFAFEMDLLNEHITSTHLLRTAITE